MSLITRLLTQSLSTTAALNFSGQKSAAPRRAGPRRLISGILALTAVLAYHPASYAQEQTCYVVADNSGPNDISGDNTQDTLVRSDFQAGNTGAIILIRRPDGTPLTEIEAMTSRPDFDEIIAPNRNEIGRIDPVTGIFTSLGTLTGANDFDALLIDRTSAGQRTLVGVSSGGNPTLVEATLDVDPETQQTRAGNIPVTRSFSLVGLPADANGVDGIALSEEGTLYGIANAGPNLPQQLVEINRTGALDANGNNVIDRGPFRSGTTLISDVEDLSFDLFGNLFASTGNDGEIAGGDFRNQGFFVPLENGVPQSVTGILPLGLDSGQTDFEGSACLRPQIPLPVGILVVKRITAVVKDGEETRFTDFVDQVSDDADNVLRLLFTRRFFAAAANFPEGVIQAPEPLSPGDEVEYTVYVHNPDANPLSNLVLCDAIELPSILDDGSIQFSAPSQGLTPTFVVQEDFAQAPSATAPDACAGLIGSDNGQFPDDLTGLNAEAGGGIVTNSFDLGTSELSVLRFRITVGQIESPSEDPSIL